LCGDAEKIPRGEAAVLFLGRRIAGIDPPVIARASCNSGLEPGACCGFIIQPEPGLIVWEVLMISLRSIALALTIALMSGPAWSASANAVKLFDTDNDGTLDLAEVKKAAAALFAKLDPDRDGTLDARELRGRLTAKELAAADPDRDGTLTLDEYLAVVEQRFNAANPDKDGTLDVKELNARAGRALLRLLR
jgi:Ca2+-binding EF-hand superfamily protein